MIGLINETFFLIPNCYSYIITVIGFVYLSLCLRTKGITKALDMKGNGDSLCFTSGLVPWNKAAKVECDSK